MIFNLKLRQGVFLLGIILSQHASAYWQKTSQNMMGTKVSIQLESQDKQQAQRCSEQAYQEVSRIEQLLSSYKPSSEISQLNQQAAQHAVKVSDETFDLIKKSIDLSKLTQGAFDITYASVGYKYDLRNHIKPSQKTIDQLKSAIDYRHVVLNRPYITFNDADVKISLGGIAKGYAVEKASALLTACGIKEAIISAGGDSKILGDHHGKQWVIGIQHPRNKEALALRIPLANTALSTSGDYERYYLDNGQRIHHIINPQTGKPSMASWSVSIIGDNATMTDALSTSVFILGEKKGLKLVNSLANIDAIIIDSHGKIHYSNGLEPR